MPQGQELGLRTRNIGRQVSLPWSKAIQISLKSLRVRFWRSMLTVSSIILAIAFLVYVWGSGRIETSVAANYRTDKEAVESVNQMLTEVFTPFDREMESAFGKLKGVYVKARASLDDGDLDPLRAEIVKQFEAGTGAKIDFAAFPTVPESKITEVETAATKVDVKYSYEGWPGKLREHPGMRLLTLNAAIQGRLSYYNAIEETLQKQGRKLTEDATRATRAQVSSLLGGVGATGVWLIVISLLVCAVGIVNAMLMSVSERFREIGTMKCLGAMDSFIVRLFILESFMQGFTGTAIGVFLGCVATLLVSLRTYGSATLRYFPTGGMMMTVVYSLVVGALLSVVAAVFPALRAARMAPVEAMRIEE